MSRVPAWLGRWRRPLPAIAEPIWQATLEALPILDGFEPAQADALRQRATAFLGHKTFETAGGMVLDDHQRTYIATLAALPILGLDFSWYRDWRTIIVYPGEFIRPRSELDTAGVMHEWEEILGGESWERGPVVLSWVDVQASGQGDGYNVVIHEVAHKLDMRNGLCDGCPPLHRGMRGKDWTSAFTAAFRDLHARIERGEEPAIDPYAAEHPGEFFAVLTEYFFEQPDLIQAEYPALYPLLAAFYRQDPAARLAVAQGRLRR